MIQFFTVETLIPEIFDLEIFITSSDFKKNQITFVLVSTTMQSFSSDMTPLRRVPLKNSNIATNIIIPIWKNSSIFPKYKFSASNSLAGGWEALKGSYNDTYYETSQTASPALSSGTYYSARYGLATTTTNTEYMILYIGSSTDSYR